MASNGWMAGEFGRDVEGSDRGLCVCVCVRERERERDVIMPLQRLRKATKRSSYGSPGRESKPRAFQIRSM